jgi:hypothetical protein
MHLCSPIWATSPLTFLTKLENCIIMKFILKFEVGLVWMLCAITLL